MCKHYITSLNNIKRKARTHEINIESDQDLFFVTIFSNCFEKLSKCEQEFINDTYFFQNDTSKQNKVINPCVYKFIDMFRREYEFI